jgi:integration host factor subunit beta
MSATKKDIAKTFSDKTSIHHSTALKMVDQLFESIMDVLAESGRIEVRNFGVFERKKMVPRKARNPRTGEVVFTIGGNSVKFKPGKEMIAKLSSLKEDVVTSDNG